MKKGLLLLVMAVMTATLWAQAPQKFSYQAVARNASGELLDEQSLTVQIGILQDGELVWQEDHVVTTNKYGVFDLQIGGEDALNGAGTAGSFAEVPWGTGHYEINIQVDDGNGFTDLGNSELLSTPYALYAANGPQGPEGPRGEQGPEGPQGERGPVGPEGPKGDAGLGLTNRGNWVTGTEYTAGDYVFDRTEADPDINSMWILEGDAAYTSSTNPYLDLDHWVEFQAPAGPQGPVGATGNTGPEGPVGPAGEQGPQGEQGLPGDPGADDQELSFDGVNLSIEDGNSVDVSSLMDGYEDADADATNELQSLSFSNGLLSLSLDPDPQSINIDSRIQSVAGWRVSDGSLETAYPIDVWTKDSQVEEPLFEVKNDDGNPVFAVYNDGVVVYVDEDKDLSASKNGGFAVGGYSKATGEVTQEYFRITPDSVRVWVPDEPYTIKGIKGGFAVGGYNKKTKAETTSYMEISRTNTNIYFDTLTTKGIKGGFAVGGYNSTKADGPAKQMMSLTPENYLIGQEAGASITTGLNNSFLGYQAGMNNTTGYENIFLGKNAGFSNYSARENIFVGNESGYNIESGYGNVLVGNSTGHENLKGYYNTFVGHAAGYYNDSHYNTGLGYQAGFHNTDGSRNIFVGFQAGFGYPTSGSGITGDDNVFIGQNSGYRNTSGSSNLFLGNNAGFFNYAGSNNVFMGTNSGYSNTTGERNVFIGEDAGRSNEMGYKNVMIGYQAGLNSKGEDGHWDNIYNVIIGHQAGYNNIDGAAKVLIGHQAGFSNESSNYMIAIGNSAGFDNTGEDNVFIGGESGNYSGASNQSVYLGHIAGRGAEGNDNVYIGYGSGYSGDGNQNTSVGSGAGWGAVSTTRENNTFIGYFSGCTVGTGSNNTALGHTSLRNISTGYNNTVLGYRAGFSLTTGYGNVFIGQAAGEDANVNNKLYIDNSDNANPLIYGDFSSDYVTINGELTVENDFNVGNIEMMDRTVGLGVNGDIIPYQAGTSYDLGNNVAGEAWDDVVANEYLIYSDVRTKKNINSLVIGLNEIMQLRPVQFQYDAKFDASGKTKYGLIAQEVESVIPEVVVNEDVDLDPDTGELVVTPNDYKLMNYMELVPVLISAIQEQQKQIESLQERIVELESK